MKGRLYFPFVFLFGCLATTMQAQSSASPFQLRFVNSDAQKHQISNGAAEGPIQLQFYLRGKFPHFGNNDYEGSWRGQSFADIPTKVYGSAAKSFSAFVYERGCSVQYVTVEDVEHMTRSVDVPCVPQQPLRLHTIIPNLDEAGSGDLVAEVRYEAIREHWIEEDQVQMNTGVSLNLGSFPILEDKSMVLELPDFGNDLTLNRHLKQGQYHIWIHQARNPHLLGYLVMPHDPSEAQRFLPVFFRYPEIIQLQFTTKNEFTFE